ARFPGARSIRAHTNLEHTVRLAAWPPHGQGGRMAGAGDDDFHRIARLRDLAEMKARPLWQALETASSRAARAALPTGRQTNGGRSTETIGFDASAMQSVDNRQSRFPFLALKLGLSLLVVAVIYEHGIFATAWRQFTHVDPGLVL